jgi:hypothetical protein
VKLAPYVVGSFALLAGACGGGDELLLCGQIPPDGCPIGRGGTCEDVVCAALYDCVEGSWTLAETCVRGGGEGGGGAGAGQGGGECAPVSLDHTGEAMGCTPDLQSPDCPVAAAETCAASACLTECDAFFLCTDDGWALAAFCDREGALVVAP